MPTRFRARLIFICVLSLTGLCLLSNPSHAQVPSSAQRDIEEQRRAQEREDQLRRQQKRPPEVRGTAAAATQLLRLPTHETPCFEIRQIELRGDTDKRFAWVLNALNSADADDAPLHKCLGDKGLGIVLKRAQDALVAKGFITTRIFAQPQDVSQGRLVLTLLPGRIRSIRFEPAAPGISSALPAQAGQVLNVRDIDQALENLNRVPTANADFQIIPAEQPDQSDLVLRYRQGFPLRLSISADDSGTKYTGRYQGTATVSWDNPLHINDLLYLSSGHDLGGGDSGPRGTRSLTMHYSVPYGYWTLGTTFTDSSYHQTVAGIHQNYVYSGTSGTAEIKLARLLYRDAVGKTTAYLKAFERHSSNYVDATEVMVQRRAVGGWELGVGHKQFAGAATVELNLAYKRGTGDFDSLRAPEEAWGGGTSRFGLIAADASLAYPFTLAHQALRYDASLRVQDNTTPLTPQDRLNIGGRYSVRGFDGDLSLSGERGYVLRQDISALWGACRQEIYVGIDHAEVAGPSTALQAGQRLTGGVVGLRGTYKNMRYDAFVGSALYQPEGFKTSDTTAGFNLTLNF